MMKVAAQFIALEGGGQRTTRHWMMRCYGRVLQTAHVISKERRADGFTYQSPTALCGLLCVPGGEWEEWKPGASWLTGFCKRCAKRHPVP